MKLNQISLISLVTAVLAGLFIGCDRPTPPEATPDPPLTTNTQSTTPQRVGEEYREALKETGKLAEQTKDQFVASMNARLQSLDQQMDELARKTETLQEEGRQEAQQKLAALKVQREKLNQKYDELKAASQDAWADTKRGFTAAMSELERAFQNAKTNFTR